MYTYYYKYAKGTNLAYIYQDEDCKIFVACLMVTMEQDSFASKFLDNLDNINFVYKGGL